MIHIAIFMALQHVVLAGGCFWGMQAVFEQVRGVTKVVAGYAGGNAATAHYETVSTGQTGHAESVDVTYDPAQVSFRQLLQVYFRVAHDPTQVNRQGPDEGTQYRSEIFYTQNDQKTQALQYMAELTRDRVFAARIATKLAPLKGFYAAEAYHQDFVAHNPFNPYVLINDKPKLVQLSREFPQLLRH